MLVCLGAQSCPTLATPWTVVCQAPLSVGFSRQEYWSGLPIFFSISCPYLVKWRSLSSFYFLSAGVLLLRTQAPPLKKIHRLCAERSPQESWGPQPMAGHELASQSPVKQKAHQSVTALREIIDGFFFFQAGGKKRLLSYFRVYLSFPLCKTCQDCQPAVAPSALTVCCREVAQMRVQRVGTAPFPNPIRCLLHGNVMEHVVP